MEEIRNLYTIIFAISEWKRPLGTPLRRWEDNIKMHLKETGCEDMDWIHLFQNRVQ
jgi:hypothetical protein